MAGHSKWANIKHRKAGQDAKRGKIFTKIIRELTVASREGGEDPATNPRLRTILDKALANNMKKDTIDKAIARGSGNLEGVNYESVTYEGYGPQGIAFFVECLTDNRQRTVAEIRHAFNKFGGNLGTDGSVAYLFNRKGILLLSYEGDEDELLELLVEVEVDEFDNFVNSDAKQCIEIQCEPAKLDTIKQYVQQHQQKFSIAILQADIQYLPLNQQALDLNDTQKNLNLVEWLEDLDDVQMVHTNLDFNEQILEQLSDDR